MLARVEQAISTISMAIASTVLLSMTLLIAASTVTRWVFGTPIVDGSAELSGYLFVTITYVGGAYALQSDAFIRMELLFSRVRSKPKVVLVIATSLLSAVMVVVLLLQAWDLVGNAAERASRSTGPLRLPLAYPYAIVVVGLALLLLQLILGLVAGLRADRWATSRQVAQSGFGTPVAPVAGTAKEGGDNDGGAAGGEDGQIRT